MKKYLLSLLSIVLAVGYAFPAQAFEITVWDYMNPNMALARGHYSQNSRVEDFGFFFHGSDSPTGMGEGNADWVELDSIVKGTEFKPVTSCQGIDFGKHYYANVDVTLNADGSCSATVK